MEQNNKLKMFISYSHQDETHVDDLVKYIAPLKDKGSIEYWYDRKIVAGEPFQEKIDVNLENADIVCLLISADFLSSEACSKERKAALESERKRGTTVVPIILSECGWLDYEEISSLLALPTDGKPISSFPSPDKAWKNVYDGIKNVIGNHRTIKLLKNTEPFLHFLNDAESLTKASSHKEIVSLDDVFIHPELGKSDDLGKYERKLNSRDLMASLLGGRKIVISGENQSGRTTLCNEDIPLFARERIRSGIHGRERQ